MADDLNFHMTFPPTPSYIGRILKISDGTSYSIEEIAEITGIPQGVSSGKVRPHLSYATYMGLIDNESMKRTMLGEIVLQEDPMIAEKLTQLLCHTILTSSKGAPMWFYMFRTLLPENHFKMTKKMILEKMQQQFGAGIKVAPAITMYTKQFTKLGILSEKDEDIMINEIHPDKEMLYVYAYSLLLEWENIFPKEKELTARQLDELRFGAIYGWNSELEYSVLQQICDLGVIGMNNQLIPFTIKKYLSSDDLVDKLYSLLF